MEKMISYCGLACDSCSIHLASLEQDKCRQHKLRESIAKQCSDLYGLIIQPEEITDCDGCRVITGRLFLGCQNCAVRKCACQLNIECCAFCSNYACAILEEHFIHVIGAKNRLEKIRCSN